jgi:hypothetical protein
MFFPESRVRVYLYGQAVDMRKSFDGLYAVARTAFPQDPTGGDLYVFVNRSGRQIKVLYFDRSGWCVWPNGWRPGSSSATGRRLVRARSTARNSNCCSKASSRAAISSAIATSVQTIGDTNSTHRAAQPVIAAKAIRIIPVVRN